MGIPASRRNYCGCWEECNRRKFVFGKDVRLGSIYYSRLAEIGRTFGQLHALIGANGVFADLVDGARTRQTFVDVLATGIFRMPGGRRLIIKRADCSGDSLLAHSSRSSPASDAFESHFARLLAHGSQVVAVSAVRRIRGLLG